MFSWTMWPWIRCITLLKKTFVSKRLYVLQITKSKLYLRWFNMWIVEF